MVQFCLVFVNFFLLLSLLFLFLSSFSLIFLSNVSFLSPFWSCFSSVNGISFVLFTWDACAAHVIKWGPFVSTNAHLSIINSF